MKITNMNRNQLASYAAQMRDRSRGLDRIMGELKGERAENRRLKKEIANDLRNSRLSRGWATKIRDRDAEIAELKKQLAAKPEAAEKVEGVFEVGDRIRSHYPYGFLETTILAFDGDSVIVEATSSNGMNLVVSHDSMAHAAPASAPCQSCAAKDAEIAALNESRTCVANECSALNDVIETLKKAAHADWVKSDRTDIELYNAKLELEKLQSRIETQRENSADTQRNLERAREIIGQHEASILRVTAELTAALGGGA